MNVVVKNAQSTYSLKIYLGLLFSASLHDLEGTSGSSITPEVPPSSAGEMWGVSGVQG